MSREHFEGLFIAPVPILRTTLPPKLNPGLRPTSVLRSTPRPVLILLNTDEWKKNNYKPKSIGGMFDDKNIKYSSHESKKISIEQYLEK